MKTTSRDYFAEMYVAGLLADAGWDIYFPRRDRGFDMIVSRKLEDTTLIRPLQVKGKYPTDNKTDKVCYGYVGEITAFHDEMVFAMPFFTSISTNAPETIAWMPRSALKPVKRGWRCEPAQYASGKPSARTTFARYFDEAGLERLASPAWPQ